MSRRGAVMDHMISAGYTAEAEGSSLPNYFRNDRVGTESNFADMMTQKVSSSPKDMTLSEYKEYFYDKLNSFPTHPSQSRVFRYIDITDAAYRRMQADPQYEQKILDFLAQEQAVNYGCHPPQFMCIRIEDTWEKCSSKKIGVQQCRHEKEAAAREAAERRRARKERRKKLLKLYLKKKAEAKKLQEMYLEREWEKRRLEQSRLKKLWNNKRRMAEAFKAYEASVPRKYR